jgi:hypothetical protein
MLENRMVRSLTHEGGNNIGLDKFHNEKLHKLYSSPNIIKMVRSRRGI